MSYRDLMLAAVIGVVGCGGKAEPNASNEADAGAIECGSSKCGPTQICVYPPNCLGFALPDGGTCPAGTTYSVAAAACLALTPSCVSPSSADQSQYDCSGGDAGAACSSVTIPIPAGCSRTCRVDCV